MKPIVTMKGIVLKEHGEVDKLLFSEEIEVPALKKDEIRVKVTYCGLNHLDIWLREGGNGDRLELPRIPGCDVVGVITAVGEEVSTHKSGDSVVLYPGEGCGTCSGCLEGRETLCRNFKILGYNSNGGYCEYVHIQEKRAVQIPQNELKLWAGVPVAYVTAWNALVTKGNMKANDTVVVWGAAGGLGNAAISIAKAFGAKVIGIVNSERKRDFLQQNGFDDVEFIIRNKNVSKQIRELTNKAGADLVLDHVGRATIKDSLKMLRRGGRLSFCGVTTGPLAEIDLRLIFGKQITITGSWMGDLSDFYEMVYFLKRRSAFPHIEQTYFLERVKEAQQALSEGSHIGKIILEI